MTEPTPPAERPLPDEARARIRADLLAHAHEHRSRAPRFAVPLAAAAAVALVAGTGYWAVHAGGDGGVGPAGSGGSASFGPETDVSDPVDEPSDVPPSDAVSLPAGPTPEGTQVGTDTCAVELKYVLRGAEEAYRDGDVSFWVKGDRYSVCYELDGSTTVTRPVSLTPGDDVAGFRVASLYPPTQSGYLTVRVAGGVVPQGLEEVFDAAYTFPDGQTEHSEVGTDASGRSWWWMVHSHDDDGGNEREQPEIEVTVSYSGVQRSYTLEWGPPDTCAQANHGC